VKQSCVEICYVELAPKNLLGYQKELLEIRGFYLAPKGFSEARMATPRYLRDRIRELFDQRAAGKVLCLHIKNDKENTIYQGCRADGWSTQYSSDSSEDPIETFICTQAELGFRHFKVNDIFAVLG